MRIAVMTPGSVKLLSKDRKKLRTQAVNLNNIQVAIEDNPAFEPPSGKFSFEDRPIIGVDALQNMASTCTPLSRSRRQRISRCF